MKIPFWLLIVFVTAETPTITSVTPFQTERECEAAKAVIQALPINDQARFNVYQTKQAAICEKAEK